MLELVLLGGFAAYNMATTHSDDHASQQGDRKIDCYDIWHQITTGPGTGSIQNGQSAAGRLKGAYADRLSTIDALAKEMDAAWTGGGSDAAQNAGAHPLRVWMEDSGTKLTDSDKYLGEQNTAFTTVHAQVQEVPKDPPKNNLLNAVTPWTTDTDRAIRDYNAKGQANVDAFNTYYKASNDNGQKMPTYSALKGQQENVNIDDGKKKPGNGKGEGNGNGEGERGGAPGVGPGGVNMPGPGGVPSFNAQPPNTPGGSFDPSKVPGGSFDPSKVPGFDPSKVPSGSYDPSKIPGAGSYTPPNFNDGTSASGFSPSDLPGVPSFGPGSTPSFSGGGGGGGFGPGGSGGIGDPTAGFGPGGSAGFGPGGSSGASLPGGAGGTGAGRGGMGAGGGAMGAGGAGAGRAGSTGMGGMGGMGHGAKGQGGGDEERTSKYLLGDDPNEIFGSDELTAPPVIGE
ncbi:Uncharacterised protein [Amycolatopsis camponoti]|uniref:PPE family domain-containing protein n=1 Tax=Amycolatopsis camponoti TaxID=2606593 RepID=A0A6I8M6S8_9PSEU|nr:hypothetical protein [Amycolatopsis camponoti]VVJ23430.1 Uncharacterised protein [Amycolatopsis camponoti]